MFRGYFGNSMHFFSGGVGFGHFLKFRECFGHYLGFRGNSIFFFFFFFLRCIGLFLGIECILDIFCSYEGIVVIFLIYRAI